MGDLFSMCKINDLTNTRKELSVVSRSLTSSTPASIAWSSTTSVGFFKSLDGMATMIPFCSKNPLPLSAYVPLKQNYNIEDSKTTQS